MKKLCLTLAISLLPFTALADGWEGGKVKIKEGVLLCDFFTIKKALILQKTGDAASVDALIQRGKCLRTPREFMAVVTKDASSYTTPNLTEITFSGASVWGAMDDMDCCYK